MATIPNDQKFIGLSASVDTTERRSALINAESQAYTMQDFIDTIGGGLPSFIEYDETEKTVWNNGQGDIISNTSFGISALKENTTGTANTAIGSGALELSTTGTGNVAVGTVACGILTTGGNNTGIGYNSLQSLTTGTGNVAIGRDADVFSDGTNFAIAIGLEARAESYSIAIGTQASSGGYSHSVVLGSAAVATANNQFVVGSTTQDVGAVTTETVSSTKTWSVIINGVAHKILLA